jgi:hypothetical protein
MSWDLLPSFRERLRALDLGPATADRGAGDLSPEGLRAAWEGALDALDDVSLAGARAWPGTRWPTACVVTTGTVPTAALEWIFLLLGRGSAVTWKHPSGAGALPGLIAAAAAPLPLAVTAARDVVAKADVVIALGSDVSVAAIRAAARPGATVYGHGHAWSCAWVTEKNLPPDPKVPEHFQDPWGRVAADAALFDGRGCLSPALVFSPLPVDTICERLGSALARAQARWPIGVVHPSEAAMIRSRRAMTRVVGARSHGEGWSVHGLTLEHIAPIALPRSIAVAYAPDAAAAAACASTWGSSLSTVGTDDPEAAPHFFAAGATRVCPIGRMQRPPLDRVHDGVHILAQTSRAVGRDSF